MKIKKLKWSELNPTQQEESLRRPLQTRDPIFIQQVGEILRSVREQKDSALVRFTREFDRVELTTFRVTPEGVRAAYSFVSSETMSALKEAIRGVRLFHVAQFPQNIDIETSPGVRCERKFSPIQKVGLYVPGGTAPLLSTVVMLGVPSQVAGCTHRILVTPPRWDGSIDPTLLVAADLLAITEIYKLGGAQAIAALAYGTESIPQVSKIFGPGNSWVTEAKLQVAQDSAGATCDLPAGPSEVMIIADQCANPTFVAADLLSQAEHGTDSQVILVSDSCDLIAQTLIEIGSQLETLPRQEIAQECLSKSLIIEIEKLETAYSICNSYAPEHLIVQVENSRKFAEKIENAGSVFIGPWTPESMGDYASGTNHVLPTYGFAKSCSGLTTESFMKSSTFQEVSWAGLQELGPVVERLAYAENLFGHKNAVSLRLMDTVLEPTLKGGRDDGSSMNGTYE